MKNMTCIGDLRRLAHRKVPRAFIDYAESGSYTEQTLRANRADLERINLRQRILCDVSNRSTKTTILGEPAALPLALAPIGLCGMQHGDGEILACRAAQEAGIPFTLSTMSICSIEDVAAAVEKPFWFQLYVMRDRGYIRALVERAAAAKCSALVLTVDLQVIGQRHRDIKNGMTVPPELRIKNLIDIATKPAWALSVARGKRKTFGNIAGHYPGMSNVTVLSKWIAEQFDPSLSWKDVEWIKSLWPGKLILKGILDLEDARIAARTGAAALVVSNHGGRQLDGAQSSISALPPIADALGSEIEIMFDGGIRSGQDIARALALGARSCMSGRAYIYGLGAGGQAGVARAIEIMRNELDTSMALMGVTKVADIDRRMSVTTLMKLSTFRKGMACRTSANLASRWPALSRRMLRRSSMMRKLLVGAAIFAGAIAASGARADTVGAVAGAGTGLIVAGPPGAVVGGVIGAVWGKPFWGPSIGKGHCWTDSDFHRHCRRW